MVGVEEEGCRHVAAAGAREPCGKLARPELRLVCGGLRLIRLLLKLIGFEGRLVEGLLRGLIFVAPLHREGVCFRDLLPELGDQRDDSGDLGLLRGLVTPRRLHVAPARVVHGPRAVVCLAGDGCGGRKRDDDGRREHPRSHGTGAGCGVGRERSRSAFRGEVHGFPSRDSTGVGSRQ